MKPKWKSFLKPCLLASVENLYSRRIRGIGIAKRKYPTQRVSSPLLIMYSGMKRYVRIHQKPTPPPKMYASRRSLFFRNALKFLITLLSTFFCTRLSLISPICNIRKAVRVKAAEKRKIEFIPNLLDTRPANKGPMTKAMFVNVKRRPSLRESFPLRDLSLIIRPKLVKRRVAEIVRIPASSKNISRDFVKYSNM